MTTVSHLFENNKKWAAQITKDNPHFLRAYRSNNPLNIYGLDALTLAYLQMTY